MCFFCRKLRTPQTPCRTSQPETWATSWSRATRNQEKYGNNTHSCYGMCRMKCDQSSAIANACTCVCAGTAESQWAAWTRRSNSMNLTLQHWSTTSNQSSTSHRWERRVLAPSSRNGWSSVALWPFLTDISIADIVFEIRFWADAKTSLHFTNHRDSTSDESFPSIIICFIGCSSNCIQMHEI